MLRNSGTLSNAQQALSFLAGWAAQIAHNRLNADVIVSPIEGDEKPYQRIKIGIADGKNHPDYTNKEFNDIVKESMTKSTNEATFEDGVLTIGKSKPLPKVEKKSNSMSQAAKPVVDSKKKESEKPE